MDSPIYRTHANGARQVFDRLRYIARQDAAGRERAGRDLVTCGHCGRTWDDGHVSGVTPAPAGRCPFEHLHETPRQRPQPGAPVPMAPPQLPHALPLDDSEARELFECVSTYTEDLGSLAAEDEDRPRLARLDAIGARLAAMLQPAAQLVASASTSAAPMPPPGAVRYFERIPAAAVRREFDGHHYAIVGHAVGPFGVAACPPRMVRADDVQMIGADALVPIGTMGRAIAQREGLPACVEALET